MAHRNQSFTHYFAQNTGHDASYNSLDDLHQPTSDLEIHLDSAPHSIHSTTNVPLCQHVERVVREYFAALGDEAPTDLYELILRQVELPLLTVVLEQTRGNQTKCAQILGLNRGTLRKKLKAYSLMS